MPTLRLSRALFRSQAEDGIRSEEHTSELQSPQNLVCRLLLEKKNVLPPIQEQALRARSPFLTPPYQPAIRPVCKSSRMPFYSFFNDTATTEIYPLSLHDVFRSQAEDGIRDSEVTGVQTHDLSIERMSTRLNSQ